ncbi:MAG: YcgN family cysteine cluster protein [Alphaproteobacteria bacterium]|nr:MAG: YcgN family cysteine cluster protein [Alphaproteobacteria bacterium]
MPDMNGCRPRFWETLGLDELSHAEWEALCDGCGKCCLLKLEDEETGEVQYTDVACRLFDAETCRCGQYALRRMLVPGCVQLTPENIAENKAWMPASCAYRLLAEGRPLPRWHPLIARDRSAVHRAGESVRGRTVPEWDVDEEELEDHLIDGVL